ncbi:YqjF family protein [Aquimarina sp. SS2-1]|uniref:YqjF family protein n=1 Tax=Aquimarina besae TaxID=3342247 RepID=UPI003671F8CE
MTIRRILKNTGHRPWELPKQPWKFYQEWNKVIFLHWKVDLDELKNFVPKELEIDTFEGSPWVSVVAFSMEKIRPKNLPYFDPISNFSEINIRTYIKTENKTGVYFLSIEGGKKLSCMIAEKISELPYRYSKMTRKSGIYTSTNEHYGDSLKIDYKIGKEQNTKSTLDIWLTERYALFQDSKENINEYEIHHPEWSLQDIEIKNLMIQYPRFETLLENNPDKMCYSKGVKVLAWGMQKKNKSMYY